MPRAPIEYVARPFVPDRFTPSQNTLQAILERQGQLQSQAASQPGLGRAQLWNTLGQLFGQYQQEVAQRTQQQAVLAQRQAEQAAAEKLRRDEMAAREQAQEAALVRQQQQDQLAAQQRAEVTARNRVVDARTQAAETVPGVVSSAQADALRPSGRIQIQDGVPVLMRTPVQVQQAATVKAAQQAAEAAAARQAGTDARLQSTFEEQARHNRATEAAAAAAAAKKTASALTLPGAYGTAFSRAIMSVPALKRPGMIQTANDIAASGTEDDLKSLIRQAAVEGENVDVKNQIIGRITTIKALEDAKTLIQHMQKSGAPTGLLSGTMEDVARKLGKTTNPAYVKMAQNLQDVLINYRRAATGAQFGEAEGRQYAKMFPLYTNDLPVNVALIDGLTDAMKGRDRAYWEYKLGPEGADLVSPGAGTQKKNPF